MVVNSRVTSTHYYLKKNTKLIRRFQFLNIFKMTERISKYQRFKMMNPIIQFFKFIFLSIKIMLVVAGGHGGTRKVQ